MPAAAAPRLLPCSLPPPAAGAGVCEICHGPAGHAYRRCWSCELVRRRLGLVAVPPIVPISLFTSGTDLHAALVGYKSDPDPDRRAAWSGALAELVGWFLSVHGRCLARVAGGGWDLLDVVPSTRRARPDHPLTDALMGLPTLGGRSGRLLRRGGEAVAHLEPAAGAFRVGRATAGARILLLDDVFTTGSHALSAASALEAAGARVVAVVPIGRLVHAERGPTREWWDHHAGDAAPGDAGPCAARRCCAALRQGSSSFPSRRAVTARPPAPIASR